MSQDDYINWNEAAVTSTLLAWWGDLSVHRGERAELRRCRSPQDVALTPAYHRLRQLMRAHGRVHDDSLAMVAGLAAHVKTPVQSPAHDAVPRLMAQSAGGTRPRVSGLRFRRLLQIREREALYVPLLRVLRQLEGAAPLPQLARDIHVWSDTEWGDRLRREWATAYYEIAKQEA